MLTFYYVFGAIFIVGTVLYTIMSRPLSVFLDAEVRALAHQQKKKTKGDEESTK